MFNLAPIAPAFTEGQNDNEKNGELLHKPLFTFRLKLCTVTSRDFGDSESGDAKSEENETPVSHDFICANCKKTKTGTRFLKLPRYKGSFCSRSDRGRRLGAYPLFVQLHNTVPNVQRN